MKTTLHRQSQRATIRRLFGNGCASLAQDTEFQPKHDPKNGQFTSGSGGSTAKKGPSSPLQALNYRASKLEAVTGRLKEGIKRSNALSRLGDKVDGEYMDIAEKEGINWNSDWQANYLKTHPKIPLDIKYDEEYEKFREEFDSNPLNIESPDEDDFKYMIGLNKKKIRKVKKNIAKIAAGQTIKTKQHDG
jgi:hypothetical protein